MFNETLRVIAQAVVDHNKAGTTDALLNEHYAADIVSVEAGESEGMRREVSGMDALRGKHAAWMDVMEMHGGDVEGPFLFEPDRFAVRYTMDATNRETGERIKGAEIALYTVRDGKITREEFFYEAG